MDNKTIKILNYFNEIDKKEKIDKEEIKPIIPEKSNHTLDIDKIKNLLELSIKNDIKLFDEFKNYKIKSKRKIIAECKEHRKNKINQYVKTLDKKKTPNNSKIKILNDKFLQELESLENIIQAVNDDNNLNFIKNFSESNAINQKDLKSDSPNLIFDEINFDSEEKKSSEDYIEIFSND